jgi:hypothetical protein
VATFEHFLPAIYAQRDKFENQDPTTATLIYDAATMDTGKNLPAGQDVADEKLFNERVEALTAAKDVVQHILEKPAIEAFENASSCKKESGILNKWTAFGVMAAAATAVVGALYFK